MSARGDATLALLQGRYSPQLPWAYHWTLREDDDGMFLRLSWWRGCGTALTCNREGFLGDRDLLRLFDHFVQNMIRDMVMSFAKEPE